MSRLSRLALAAVALALMPQMARAEGPPLSSVKVYCQPGSLNNCFAFAIQSDDGHITYFIQNLQGSIAPGGGVFSLNRIMFADPAVNDFPARTSMRFFDGAPRLVVAEGNATRGFNSFAIDNSTTSFQRTYSTNGGLGLIGCTNPLAVPPFEIDRNNFIVQTCLAGGLDGWARFDVDAAILGPVFGESRPATLDDFYVQIAGCDLLVGSKSGATPRGTNCATDINYADLRASFTTVPEPSSIALLGSGLTGMGLIGRRRLKS